MPRAPRVFVEDGIDTVGDRLPERNVGVRTT
jgi:hypothetical protein